MELFGVQVVFGTSSRCQRDIDLCRAAGKKSRLLVGPKILEVMKPQRHGFWDAKVKESKSAYRYDMITTPCNILTPYHALRV